MSKQDHSKRFEVYLNYVRNIAGYLEQWDVNPMEMLESVVQSNRFKKLQGGAYTKHRDSIGQFLRNAWHTELLPSAFNEGKARLTSHWMPVHSYYIVHLALKAHFLSCNNVVPDTHTASLREIANQLKGRPELFPQPWRVVCTDSSEVGRYECLPEGVCISKISPLGAQQGFWNRYAAFLRTTRKRQMDDKIKEYKKKYAKKKLSKEDRIKINDSIAPTSIFNCLYRMRVRSNYDDPDSFLFSGFSELSHREFNESLRKIIWYLMLCLELLVAKSIGGSNYGALVQSFKVEHTSELMKLTVEGRWETIKNCL